LYAEVEWAENNLEGIKIKAVDESVS